MSRPSRYSPKYESGLFDWSASTQLTRPRGGDWVDRRQAGVPAETLRKWVRQAERDTGQRAGLTTEAQRLRALEREVRELKRTNEILRKAGLFCPGGARPPGGDGQVHR